MCAKTASITVSPAPLTPSDASRAVDRLRGALVADELEDDALPRANLVLGDRRELARRTLEARHLAEQGAAGDALAPGTRRSLGCPLGRRAHDSLDAVLDGDLQLGVRGGGARDDALQPIAEPAHTRLERAHHVARPDDLVPARQHLAAKQRAAAQSRLHLPQRLRIGELGLGAKVGGDGELLHRRPLDDERPHRQACERTAQRPAHEGGPRLRIGCEPVEPGADRPERGRVEQLPLERHLGDDQDLGVAELLGLEHLAEMSRNLGARVGWHPVEHDRERGPALPGGAKELPGNGVGIAGSGRDEEPAVRRGQQLVGERTVLGQHRVDVGGVEQREALRQRFGWRRAAAFRPHPARRSRAPDQAGRGRPRTRPDRPGGRRAPASASSGAALRPG